MEASLKYDVDAAKTTLSDLLSRIEMNFSRAGEVSRKRITDLLMKGQVEDVAKIVAEK